ncbi:follistatin-related protein 5-like isoform X2 [Phymastichus coffea]|uniref:follistatin-related protein 5-like isoform X2 n=1 Tax=Phymastichus coffea TaxID=108790 RepID=UPI00273C888A|nr:follistatin-related protein 5-like isoform X2 [Phymastichus coffea]
MMGVFCNPISGSKISMSSSGVTVRSVIVVLALLVASCVATGDFSSPRYKHKRHHYITAHRYLSPSTPDTTNLPQNSQDAAAVPPTPISIEDDYFGRNPCIGKYCGAGRECQVSDDGSQGVCVCARRCARRHRPVCGSDGKVYANHCELHRAACNLGSPLTASRLMRCLHRGVSVVSLDKNLEINHIPARVGDNVEIKCDVTGTPPPPLVWRRYNADLESLSEPEIRIFNDGSLYLTRVQLAHAGNYTCHALSNKDVVQTHVLTVHTTPEVRVTPRLQSKRPGEETTMRCHVVGEPLPRVEWLKNDEALREAAEKYEVVGNGTRLAVRGINYADTGAYMCQATSVGGVTRDISSLVVQEQPTPTAPSEERRFFSFHEWGISVYEPSACRLYHQIKSTDIIPGTQEYVCAEKGVACTWGRAINVANRYVYVSQPEKDRILIISKVQMVVVDVVTTDKYPVELQYVPALDQVWLLNWRSESDMGVKTIQVIRDAAQKKKHRTVHPEPIDGQFDLVRGLYIPERQDIGHAFKYGYVTHTNQRGMYKLDLANMRYTRSADLAPYNCVPAHIVYPALYGFVILQCEEPITGKPTGQLLLDYVTDTVLSHKPELLGKPSVSPDSRHLVTLDRRQNGVVLIVEEILPTGLNFIFDVKTTLNVSDITFYPSQTTHGYDLYASSMDNKEDILFLNLSSGKVEMITGVGKAMPLSVAKWGKPNRPIVQSGVFGRYMVSPSSEALFVLNGETRTVNCEIGGLVHPSMIVWFSVSTH